MADKCRLTTSEVKARLKEINPTIETIGKYLDSNKSPLKCKCLVCKHRWTSSWGNLNQRHGCPRCSAGKSEEDVRLILEEMTGKKWPSANPTDVPFLHGLTLDGFCRELKSKKFPNGTAFERQGEQHYHLFRWNNFNHDELLKQKRRDWRKRTQCWRHGIRLIRIPYWIKDVKGYLKRRVCR